MKSLYNSAEWGYNLSLNVSNLTVPQKL